MFHFYFYGFVVVSNNNDNTSLHLFFWIINERDVPFCQSKRVFLFYPQSSFRQERERETKEKKGGRINDVLLVIIVIIYNQTVNVTQIRIYAC